MKRNSPNQTGRTPPTLRKRLLLSVASTVVLAFLVVLVIVLVALHQSLVSRDRAELRGELEQLEQSYALGGLRHLRLEIEENSVLDSDRPFFVRVANDRNETLLAHVPSRWHGFDFERLADIAPEQMPDVYRIEALGASYDIEVMTTRVPGGGIIQVGTSTSIRTHMLSTVATIFLLVAGPLALAIVALTAFNVSRITASISDVTVGARYIMTTGRYDAPINVRKASKETDEMVATFNALLARVNDLVGRLRVTLNSLAHDIRTPIARMRSRAELALSEKSTSEQLQTALSDTVEESQAVVELLQRFLDASEAESGTLNIHPGQNELQGLIEPVLEAYEFVADEKNISIRRPESAEVWVRVDGVRLRQALSNLLDNAVKFSPSGTTIRVDVSTDSDHVVIAVEDQGPGFSEEHRHRLWDYQVRGESGGSSSGYGLGLTIVRAVAEAHGGTVEASNLPAGGSRFSIRLPVS